MKAHESALIQTENVDHAARRAYDNLTPSLEGVDLLGHGGTAVDGSDANAQHLAELGGLIVDLGNQLARRGEDDADGTFAFSHGWLVENVAEKREEVGEGFA